MFWNLALDQNDEPSINDDPVHGCESNDANRCLPLVQVNNGNAPGLGTAALGRVTYQVGYYVLAQVSKFVQPGATRIGSSNNGTLHSVRRSGTRFPPPTPHSTVRSSPTATCSASARHRRCSARWRLSTSRSRRTPAERRCSART
jgi:hypothetical protein